MDGMEKKIISLIDAGSKALTGSVRDLVSIPTVNPYSGDDDAAGEKSGQEWIAGQMSSIGAKVRRIPVKPDVYRKAGVLAGCNRSWKGRDNVVGEWNFGKGGPAILLNSHMDTVGVKDMEISPFDPVVKKGRIYGRGTSDSKGNLVMTLAAIRSLLETGERLNGKILFASVVDEECGGAGAGTLACCQAGITGDMAIVLDGGRGLIASGCNGCTTAKLTVYGMSGHSSAGHSVSAIDKGMIVKQAIDEFASEYARRHPTCRGSVRIFRAGNLPSVVPNTAELWINMTYDYSEAQLAERKTGKWGGELFQSLINKKLKGLAKKDLWFKEKPVDVKWIYDLVPFKVNPDGLLPATALKACRDTGDLPAKVCTMPAWFDAANISRQLKIPVIGMGHGTPGTAHSANEYVEIAGLCAGAKALAVTLSRLMQK